jgi:hypothetical protein
MVFISQTRITTFDENKSTELRIRPGSEEDMITPTLPND